MCRCDRRTAVKTLALVRGSVGAETARSVGRAACSSFLDARRVLCSEGVELAGAAVKIKKIVRGAGDDQGAAAQRERNLEQLS